MDLCSDCGELYRWSHDLHSLEQQILEIPGAGDGDCPTTAPLETCATLASVLRNSSKVAKGSLMERAYSIYRRLCSEEALAMISERLRSNSTCCCGVTQSGRNDLKSLKHDLQ